MHEQEAIIRRVQLLFALADRIEERGAAATERADRPTQAVLSRAFRGELVPTAAELARQEGRELRARRPPGAPPRGAGGRERRFSLGWRGTAPRSLTPGRAFPCRTASRPELSRVLPGLRAATGWAAGYAVGHGKVLLVNGVAHPTAAAMLAKSRSSGTGSSGGQNCPEPSTSEANDRMTRTICRFNANHASALKALGCTY